MDLSIQYTKPIGFGILTCENYDQAIIRSDPNKKIKVRKLLSSLFKLLDNI